MNTLHSSAALLVLSMFAVACNGATGDEDGAADGGGINLSGTDGESESESDGETDGDEGRESDSDAGETSFPEPGDSADSDGSVPVCGGQTISLLSSPPSVMLLLDKSGSMVSNTWDHDGSTDTEEVRRWASLHDVTSELLADYGDRVNFGAVLFPAADAQVLQTNDYDTQFASACKMADVAEVAIGPNQQATVLDAIPTADADFEGATPTREAVLNGIEHLEDAAADGPRAMILITDGAANCVYEPGSNIGKVYDTELEETVRSAHGDHDITTYVVGIDIRAEHPAPGRNLTDDMNAVASAGGVPRQDGSDELFYNVRDQDALAEALDEIARRVECTVALDTVPGDPEAVLVDVDGVAFPQLASCDDGDGWRYVSDAHNSIELCNAACTDFREVEQLDTTYTCPPAA